MKEASIIILTFVQMIIAFVLGFSVAMLLITRYIRKKIIPKGEWLLDRNEELLKKAEAGTITDDERVQYLQTDGIIRGRLDVLNELADVMKAPFYANRRIKK